jgi:hypothetical protein
MCVLYVHGVCRGYGCVYMLCLVYAACICGVCGVCMGIFVGCVCGVDVCMLYVHIHVCAWFCVCVRDVVFVVGTCILGRGNACTLRVRKMHGGPRAECRQGWLELNRCICQSPKSANSRRACDYSPHTSVPAHCTCHVCMYR